MIFSHKLDDCEDGDIKLVGDHLANDGRLEMCLDRKWGTVSDDGWSTSNTEVVCRQLGYSTQGTCN